MLGSKRVLIYGLFALLFAAYVVLAGSAGDTAQELESNGFDKIPPSLAESDSDADTLRSPSASIYEEAESLEREDEEGEIYNGQLTVPDNIRLDRLTMTASISRPLESARVSSLFGYRENPVTHKFKFHSGLDLAAPEGDPIRAMLAGTVTTAGYDSGYGNYIIIDHGDGLQTLYGHCSKLLCKKGDTVKKGQKIGKVGSTGNSTGPHLHVEFRKDGQRYDPEWILSGMY